MSAKPRTRGKDHRPMLTARVAAGLQRLPSLVTADAPMRDPEIAAALRYVAYLAEHYHQPAMAERRAAAAALSAAQRKKRSSAAALPAGLRDLPVDVPTARNLQRYRK